MSLHVDDPVVAARALIRLASLDRPGAGAFDKAYRSIAALVAATGGAPAALDALASGEVTWPEHQDLFADARIRDAIETALVEREAWDQAGLYVAAISGAGYPEQLEQIADAPPLVFIHGAHDVVATPGVAIVGTRRPTAEGIRRAARAARAFVARGITVFSGMARGIDGAAHEATMASGGRTVAVMGTPIDRRYPAEHAQMADAIVRHGGALVSEFLPGRRTAKWDFIRRNKTMSGLTAVTLVIEAGETSGARSQAEAALKHGRSVFLPESLVTQHAWGRRLVDHGIDGVRAVLLRDPSELAELLTGLPTETRAGALAF